VTVSIKSYSTNRGLSFLSPPSIKTCSTSNFPALRPSYFSNTVGRFRPPPSRTDDKTSPSPRSYFPLKVKSRLMNSPLKSSRVNLLFPIVDFLSPPWSHFYFFPRTTRHLEINICTLLHSSLLLHQRQGFPFFQFEAWREDPRRVQSSLPELAPFILPDVSYHQPTRSFSFNLFGLG